MFKSILSNQTLAKAGYWFYKDVPTQLPNEISEQNVVASAEAAKDGMTSMFILQLIMQVCLKGSLNDLWLMFFTLQIMCYLVIYDIPIPANAGIFLVEFTRLIEFDILNPETFIRLITGNPDFDLVGYITGVSPFEAGQVGILNELVFFIFAVVAALVVIIFMILITAVTCIRTRIVNLLIRLKKQFFFNGLIRSVTIMYIQVCMSAGNQVKLWIQGEWTWDTLTERIVGTS